MMDVSSKIICSLTREEFRDQLNNGQYLNEDWKCRICLLLVGQHPPRDQFASIINPERNMFDPRLFMVPNPSSKNSDTKRKRSTSYYKSENISQIPNSIPDFKRSAMESYGQFLNYLLKIFQRNKLFVFEFNRDSDSDFMKEMKKVLKHLKYTTDPNSPFYTEFNKYKPDIPTIGKELKTRRSEIKITEENGDGLPLLYTFRRLSRTLLLGLVKLNEYNSILESRRENTSVDDMKRLEEDELLDFLERILPGLSRDDLKDFIYSKLLDSLPSVRGNNHECYELGATFFIDCFQVIITIPIVMIIIVTFVVGITDYFTKAYVKNILASKTRIPVEYNSPISTISTSIISTTMNDHGLSNPTLSRAITIDFNMDDHDLKTTCGFGDLNYLVNLLQYHHSQSCSVFSTEKRRYYNTKNSKCVKILNRVVPESDSSDIFEKVKNYGSKLAANEMMELYTELMSILDIISPLEFLPRNQISLHQNGIFPTTPADHSQLTNITYTQSEGLSQSQSYMTSQPGSMTGNLVAFAYSGYSQQFPVNQPAVAMINNYNQNNTQINTNDMNAMDDDYVALMTEGTDDIYHNYYHG